MSVYHVIVAAAITTTAAVEELLNSLNVSNF